MKKWKEYYLKDIHRYGGVKIDRKVKKLLKSFRKCQFCRNKLSLFLNRYTFRSVKKALNTNAVSTQSDSIQKDKIEETDAKANALGIKPEEFIQLFNMAQEARVKELEKSMNLDELAENNVNTNPFSDN